jgi:hypothetical protein
MNYRDKMILLITSLDEVQLQHLHNLAVKEFGEMFDSRLGGEFAADAHAQEELMFSRFL